MTLIDRGSTGTGVTLQGVGTPAYDREERVGFFTDTSICIGCKACVGRRS